jgi:hypothetical protein
MRAHEFINECRKEQVHSVHHSKLFSVSSVSVDIYSQREKER